MNRGYLSNAEKVQNSRVKLAHLMGYDVGEELSAEEKRPNQVWCYLSIHCCYLRYFLEFHLDLLFPSQTVKYSAPHILSLRNIMSSISVATNSSPKHHCIDFRIDIVKIVFVGNNKVHIILFILLFVS